MRMMRLWNRLVRQAMVASGQAGWAFEQAGLVEDAPAHGRGVKTR